LYIQNILKCQCDYYQERKKGEKDIYFSLRDLKKKISERISSGLVANRG